MDYAELLEKVKTKLRVSIGARMDLPTTREIHEFLGVRDTARPEDRQAFIDGRACLLPNAIDRCITSVMALGSNDTAEAAAIDLHEMRSGMGGSILFREDALQSLAYELHLCASAFSEEIRLFSQMHQLAKSGMSHEDVWARIEEVNLGSR